MHLKSYSNAMIRDVLLYVYPMTIDTFRPLRFHLCVCVCFSVYAVVNDNNYNATTMYYMYTTTSFYIN